MLIVPGLSCRLLEHHFFRNKASYIVGRLYVEGDQMPFVLPLLHNESMIHPLFTWMPFCLVPIR